jgi:hypothetical protein
VYQKVAEGNYQPIVGYNFNRAYDRVKFAIQNTADKTEKKALSYKLTEAKRFDWMKANPRKNGESLEAYIARAKKEIK